MSALPNIKASGEAASGLEISAVVEGILYPIAKVIGCNAASEIWQQEIVSRFNSHPEMLAALKVVLLTPAIRDWLSANDPRALEQIGNAIIKAIPS